jgi:hypothetical protein
MNCNIFENFRVSTIECYLHDEEMRVGAVCGKELKPIRRISQILSTNDVKRFFRQSCHVEQAEVLHAQRGADEYIWRDGFFQPVLEDEVHQMCRQIILVIKG